MLENLKSWLLNVGIQVAGPSAIRGAVLGLSGWFFIRNGYLSQFGIVSDAVARTTTIHWDQLSAWAIVSIPALLAGAIKAANYHAANFVKGDPQ